MLDAPVFQIVTYAKSGIKTLADLAGKRVSIGAPGSGSAITANLLFPLAGLKGKLTIQNLGFNESTTNLRDGNLDAFATASALPVPAIVDLATTGQVRLLDIPPKLIAALHKDSPYYQPFDIPAGTYSGVDKVVHAIADNSLLLTRADVPDDVVTELLTQMYTPEALKYMHNVYHAWDPKPGSTVFKDIQVPLHPAALKFYRAHGMIR